MQQAWIKDLFFDLVRLDSPSLHEGQVAVRCKAELERLGFHVEFDDAHLVLGGETGNLIATLDGDPQRRPILLAAHMDTVQPGEGIRPHLDEDAVIWSDGKTVLGADDKAGITAILAGLKEVVEQQVSHGPIQVILTIAEEIGLQGAKHLNRDKLRAEIGLSLDSGGDLGTVVIAGPAQVRWEAVVTGRAAHAGVAPEAGISAIKVAAAAVGKMPHGRIDHETTVNIGSFVGQGPSNVVRDRVSLVGEARSRNPESLKRVLQEIEQAFLQAAAANGAKAVFEWKLMYDGFRFEEDALVRSIAEQALVSEGFTPCPVEGGGGSDANIYTSFGVPTINVGIGYAEIHSTHEHIKLSDLESAARMVAAFCRMA